MVKIKPITLEIDQKIWKEFKEVTRKNTTLNDAVVDLIKLEVEKEKLTALDVLNKTPPAEDLIRECLIKLMKEKKKS